MCSRREREDAEDSLRFSGDFLARNEHGDAARGFSHSPSSGLTVDDTIPEEDANAVVVETDALKFSWQVSARKEGERRVPDWMYGTL